MKKIFAAALALTLLGSTAAFARGDQVYRGPDRVRHHDGAALVAGLGIAALAIIAANQSTGPVYSAAGPYGYGPSYPYDAYGPYAYGPYAYGPTVAYGGGRYIGAREPRAREDRIYGRARDFDAHRDLWRHDDRR